MQQFDDCWKRWQQTFLWMPIAWNAFWYVAAIGINICSSTWPVKTSQWCCKKLQQYGTLAADRYTQTHTNTVWLNAWSPPKNTLNTWIPVYLKSRICLIWHAAEGLGFHHLLLLIIITHCASLFSNGSTLYPLKFGGCIKETLKCIKLGENKIIY